MVGPVKHAIQSLSSAIISRSFLTAAQCLTLLWNQFSGQVSRRMLEVTHGRTKNQPVAKDVRQLLLSLNLDGSLYIGYPVLATADESITVDALLVTLQHGLVAFLFDELSSVDEACANAWHGREDRQNQLFVAVENNLRRHESLRRG